MSFFRAVCFAAACLLALVPNGFGQASISYSGTNTTTEGKWTGTYGGDGFAIVNNNGNSLPSYASLDVSSIATYTWAAQTTDARAPQSSSGAGTGIASCLCASNFTMKVTFNDSNPHQVALYLLDWDTTSRGETVQIVSKANSAVQDTESFSGFHNGAWAVWTVTGSVNIVVTSTTSNNAVVSGIFFGPAAGGSSGGSSGGTTASFTQLDTGTKGLWTNHYGSNGYIIANSVNAAPSYATLTPASSPYTPSGAALYTWAPQVAMTDPARALQTAANSSNGIASCFCSGGFSIGVNLTDGNAHQIALYLLDWDTSSRAESITITDASSGRLLASQNVSNFNAGVWAVFTVQGNVNIQVANLNSFGNVVVSGIFFDPASSTGTTQMGQTITFGAIGTQTVGTPLTLAGTASSGLPVTYSAAPSSVCSVSGVSASFVTSGNCTITAMQGGNSNYAAATNVTQTFAVVSGGGSGSSATFVKADGQTAGNWTSKYGKDGYYIANGASSQPSYATVNFAGDATWTWAAQPSDSRALLIPSGPGAGNRIASCYYTAPYPTSTFTIQVNITDGNAHQMAMYLLDWDYAARSETISIQGSGAALTESFSGMGGGTWAVWTITGSVVIQVSNNNGYGNAVVSAIVFDPVGGTTPQQQQPQSITFGAIPAQTVGGSLALAATASSGLGVTYSASPAAVCTVSGSTAMFVSAGICSVTASQGGNGSYLAAAPVTETFTVNAAVQPITVTEYIYLNGRVVAIEHH